MRSGAPPVIRLHLLGAIRLEADDGPARPSALSQPRRAALLAYLALRARRGPERRDTLLGVFWPESDNNHARGALRNALHFLRNAVGPDAIRSLGSEEVQLDLDRVWCDAVEFERLCDAGDHAAAMRLYGGDLLSGFFISEAPDFEQWLDRERARLRRRAVEAARSLAAAAESAGEVGLAMVRLRQVLGLAPTDEAAVRWLMRLLADADDRGGALELFADTRARLAAEYGLEPASETVRLAEDLRARGEERDLAASASPAMPAVPPPAARSSIEPVLTTTGAGPGRRRRRRLLATAGGLAVVALGAIAIRVLGQPDIPSGDVVAVLPFEYRGAPEHAYLAGGVADLLAWNLNGAGDLHAVAPRALLPQLQSATTQPVPPDVARRAAAAHGAGLFILGSVTEAAGRLRIHATLFRGAPSRAGARPENVVAEGALDDLLRLVDRVSIDLLGGRDMNAFARAAARTSHSVDAVKAFLQGEAAARRHDGHAAIERYRRATEIDPTFALAHYRLSTTAYWNGIAEMPATSAAAALRHAARLAREDSLLVAAWYHHVSGSVDRALDLYQVAFGTWANHVEAAFMLGELRYHWGALVGVPAAEARTPFRRVLDADPYHVDAALHLARIAARDGRPHELDSLVSRMHAMQPGGGWITEMDVLRALLGTDRAAQHRAIAAAGGGADALLEQAVALSGNLADGERLIRERLHLERSPPEQARSHLFLAHVQLARGRYRDAVRDIAAAAVLPASRRLEYRAMMATLPFLPLPRDDIAAVRFEVASHADTPLHDVTTTACCGGIEYPHALWPGMYRPRRLYLLAALHVRLDDLARAAAVADSIGELAATDGFAPGYERLTRARMTAGTGGAAAGLQLLGQPQPPPLRTFEDFVDHGRPYERWLRAELLREAGRVAEALRWYGTFPDPLARDLAYLAPSHLRRGEIHDMLGDSEHATFHYRRFVELWADADPELQPQVERVRKRILALSD
jgi:DNA-binding SARP family transcriptional activator/TolB-like protein